MNKDCVSVTDLKQEIFRFTALRSAQFRVDEDTTWGAVWADDY